MSNTYTIDLNLAKDIPLPSSSYKNLTKKISINTKNNFYYQENLDKLFLKVSFNNFYNEHIEMEEEIDKELFFQSIKDIVEYESELRIHETILYSDLIKSIRNKLTFHYKNLNEVLIPSNSIKEFNNGIGILKNKKTNEIVSFFHKLSINSNIYNEILIKEFYPKEFEYEMMNANYDSLNSFKSKYSFYFIDFDSDTAYEINPNHKPELKVDSYSHSQLYREYDISINTEIFSEEDKKELKNIQNLYSSQDNQEELNEARMIFCETRNKKFKDLQKIKKYSDIEF
jgi:hypothetical protein